MVSDVEDQADSSVSCVYDRSKWIPSGDRSRPEHPVVPDCPLAFHKLKTEKFCIHIFSPTHQNFGGLLNIGDFKRPPISL